MHYRYLSAVSGVLLLLSGCASTTTSQKDAPESILQDQLFPSYTLFAVETEDQIFSLDEEARAFVDSAIKPHKIHETNIRSLIRQIFDHSEMGLLYRGDANSVANETFHNQSANCLSLSIMTYAMAKYAGFDAQFYEVDIPEYWTRRSGYSLLNGHINLRITTPEDVLTTSLKTDFVDVDFDPQDVRKYFPRYTVSKKVAMAMFYNNKGADALMANSYSKAYAYFREAATLAPDFPEVWVNLGVLYRMNDAEDAAEKSYRKAIALGDDNLTAWENLAVLYRRQGRDAQADEITARLERERQDNPFYHFILGEQALEEAHYQEALAHYRDAYRLDRNRHEVLFGLGKAYYELGDITNAKKYLAMAARHAPSRQDEMNYRGKLSILQDMASL